MAHRIEVGLKKHFPDPRGSKMLRFIELQLPLKISDIRLVDVFTIDGELDAATLKKVAGEAFVDPVLHDCSIDAILPGEFDWIAEVGFRPGVTDNVGRTATESLALILKDGSPERRDMKAAYSVQYRIRGEELDREKVSRLASEFLYNGLIQRCTVYSSQELRASRRIEPVFPKVTEAFEPKVEFFDLGDLSDEGLLDLSRRRVLALTVDEMKIIRDYFKSDDVLQKRSQLGMVPHPTDVELECLAQTWSEHCKHKIFNALIDYHDEDTGIKETVDSLFRTTIVETTEEVRKSLGSNDYCLSVFKDNAGVIKFDDDHVIAFKVETHNSPSALDPYGGALTGIVGVNRDPLGTGMGTMLLFNTNVFCLGYPDHKGELPPRVLHPMRILEGVREGVEHGGNKSGIPTINGSVLFDERFTARPLVYCGTGGIAPATVAGRPSWRKCARPGDAIVMIGGRIGKDGIHGATFSSEQLHEGSPASAVQIGDPITQKRMSDFLLRARDEGLYSSVTDNGAGGLSSSIGEMAQEAGGAEVDLTGAPLKYPGLHAWEIFLSEAQERMTVAVPPEKLDRFLELAGRMSVQATVLGRYNDSGLLSVKHRNETVALMHLEFIHGGLPRMNLGARWSRSRCRVNQKAPPPKQPDPADLPRILSRPNVASKEYWVRQYDHEVQAGSVVKPLCGPLGDGPSDGAVIMPVLGSRRALAVTHGICPRYSDGDTYAMAACAVDEAVRNAVSVGADPSRMAALDNFCWTDPIASPQNPEGEFKLAQLVRACRGLKDICIAYNLPLISGKDSMKNDYKHESMRLSIPPTLLVTVLGIVPDAQQAVTMYAKAPGDAVYVLGTTRDELGCSEWAGMYSIVSGKMPEVRSRETIPLYDSLYRAVSERLVRSCHDCSDGGLAAALAETAFAGGLGMDIDLAAVPAEGRPGDGVRLFSESAGRFVVTVDPGDCGKFESLMEGHAAARVGTVVYGSELKLKGSEPGREWKWDIGELKEAWRRPLAF
jgi:phosphoribosylformylglycinamidine synthase II